LTALAALIEAGDEAGVRARLATPPNYTAAQVSELVRAVIRSGAVTVKGASALATVGTHGSMGKLFPIAGAKSARELKLEPKACYGLKHGDIEVLGHWDGTQFRFFRLDYVNKAAPP